MPNKSFSMLDLMALPDAQQAVALYLVEQGKQTKQDLAGALSIELTSLEKTLETLIKEGYVSKTSEGAFQIELGKREFRPKPKQEKKTDDVDDFASLIGGALDDLMNFDD